MKDKMNYYKFYKWLLAISNRYNRNYQALPRNLKLVEMKTKF